MKKGKKQISIILKYALISIVAISMIGITNSKYASAQCLSEWTIDACVELCTATEGTCKALCGAAEQTCKGLCSATSGVCGGLCGAAEETCKGLVWFGCNVAFGWCKNWLCKGKYNSCINGGYSGCQADCNKCKLPCRSGCDIACENCRLPCEEDCHSFDPCQSIGEWCQPIPGIPGECSKGLECVSTWFLDAFNNQGMTCFPSDTDELFPDDFCLSLYSTPLHEAAIDIETAMSYGASSGTAAGVSRTTEVGAVYGADGRFGCYLTECWGVETDLSVSSAACVGMYDSTENFEGSSIVSIQEASLGIMYQTLQVWIPGDIFIGTASCIGLETPSPDDFIIPFDVGLYDCSAIVNWVGDRDESGKLVPSIYNNRPSARCKDVIECADADTCYADANINNGSFDQDGDPIELSQNPIGPYGIESQVVNLTVTDSEGESDSCNALVTVKDCTPPNITCPISTLSECESAQQSFIDPGDATTVDCSNVTVTDPGPASYPLGNTTVTYTGVDAWGNSSSCETTVSVMDTTVPEISCNSNDIVPSEAPISFTAEANDACDETFVDITSFECFKFTKEGKRIDKSESCVVELDGNTVTILDSGGVDTRITWTVYASDPSGNSATNVCALTVQNPGKVEGYEP